MTFRKAPVSAVAVLHKQHLCVLLVAVENHSTAGFFVKTAYTLHFYITQAGKYFFKLRLVINLSVRSDYEFIALESLKFGNGNNHTVKVFFNSVLACNKISAFV